MRANIGYTGQRRSQVSGCYQLGNGYRGVNPVLKRFAGQDSLSPFGAGEAHGFAYCGCNPVNRTDPSGHMFRILLGEVFESIIEEASLALAEARRPAEAILTDMPEETYDNIFSYLDLDSLNNLADAIPEDLQRPEFQHALVRRRTSIVSEMSERASRRLLESIDAYSHSIDPINGDYRSAMIHEAWLYRSDNHLLNSDLNRLFNTLNRTSGVRFNGERGVHSESQADTPWARHHMFEYIHTQYLPEGFNGGTLSFDHTTSLLSGMFRYAFGFDL